MNWARLRRNLAYACLPVVVCLTIQSVPWFLWYRYQIAFPELNATIVRFQGMWLGVCGGFLGLFVAARHPIKQPLYREWLQRSPWHAGLALPLGPVAPGLADALFLALFVALAWMFAPNLSVPALAFMATYAVSAAMTLTRIGPRIPAIAVWIGLAAMVRFYHFGNVFPLLVLATYAVAHVGMLQSLRTFPWRLDEQKLPEMKLGWVFDRLGPRAPKPLLGPWASIATPLIGGWWLYCVLARTPLDERVESPLYFIIAGIVALFGLIRWGIYGGAPPISLRGRLRTGRLIVPGYDVVLVTPILSFLIAAAMPAGLIHSRVSPSLAVAVTAAVVLLLLLNGPPTLTRWKLTGQYRMAIGTSAAQNRNADADGLEVGVG